MATKRRESGYMAKTEKIVGVRELRDRLSAYLQRVANGESITIGVRRTPVARLVPAAPAREAAALDRLVASGAVRRATRKPGARGPVKLRKRQRRLVSDIVSEDRR
ncbi:MAG TPA: type II toxin-antitoxin system prevent-host-death family antitoxin [Myxococcota bacterium]|nr:type II toxin-antitoxin system prevent-host-death family antitoxin [Myxococcota bacterium]